MKAITSEIANHIIKSCTFTFGEDSLYTGNRSLL